MLDWLPLIYPYAKAFHVMAVISWMAGLFYLPRLFVYHAERGQTGVEPVASLVIMEDKLLRLIMRPAMIATWASGLTLVLTPGIVSWSFAWPWVKAGAVIAHDGLPPLVRPGAAAAGPRKWPDGAALSHDERGPDAADGHDRQRRNHQVLSQRLTPRPARLICRPNPSVRIGILRS